MKLLHFNARLSACTLLFMTATSQAQNPPQDAAGTAAKAGFAAPRDLFRAPNQGQNIQRTMRLLATSSPQKKNKVRVLFYGQSITHGWWTQEVSRYLRETYPNADLEIENRALGGFSSQVLIKPAEHDVYPFYPDLVIFHVYGSHYDYESIIRNIRSRTTAEILISNDHYTGPSDWSDWFSHSWVPSVAARYNCELADVRSAWRKYLSDNKLEASALLSDTVHLNAHGNFLLAELIKPHLTYNPDLARPEALATVRDIKIPRDAQWKNGRLKLEFEGNRVDALLGPATVNGAAGTTQVQVLVDGKKPSSMPELYAFTRPSGTPHIGWPAIIRFHSQSPLLIEDWTARVSNVSADASKFDFEIRGSKTGPDGSGRSDQKFVSKSGRIVIEPGDWWFKNDHELSKKPTPEGYEVKWSVVPLFADSFGAPKIEDAAREYPVTLAQNLSNARHTLELVAPAGAPPVRAIRVFQPPVR